MASWSAAAARKVSQARQQDRPALVLEPLGQLGDRRRLPRAVDPGDQVDARLLGRDGQRPRPGVLQQRLELGLDEREQVLVGGLVGEPLADPLDQPAGRRDADVRLDQPALQLVQERLVDLAAEPRADVEEPGRPGQPLLEPFQQA